MVNHELSARDRGLSSLGLLMQLGGTLFAAAIILCMFMSLVAIGGSPSDLLVMFLILALCGVRSMFHRQAGIDLLYSGRALADAPHDYLAGVRRYVIIAFAQTAIIALLLVAKWHADITVVLGVSAGLALWPAILAIVIRLPSFQVFKTGMPETEDKGFEGASILMATFGGVGVCVGMALVFKEVQGNHALAYGSGVLVVLGLVALVIRSVIHLQAGMAGLRETSVASSAALANRYATIGVLTSFGLGGVLLVYSLTTSANVFSLGLICAVVWVLLTWPLVIRRFFTDRQFAALVASEDESAHRRASDGGLSGLGWLLVVTSVASMSLLLPSLITGQSLASLFDVLPGIGRGHATSPWWTVGFAALQAWAGVELITMGRRHRVIGFGYAIAGSLVQLYLMWPVIQLLWQPDDASSMAVVVGNLAYALALPIATFVLVSRQLAPTAFARFRTRKP
jgi:hypothetical protein